MNKKLILRPIDKYVSYILLAAFFMQFVFISPQTFASEARAVRQVYNDKIAKEISFKANNWQNASGNLLSEYIITADLNDPSVQVITAKADDEILKVSTLTEQIAREQSKGQNVVAGINGDMYNISSGSSYFGAPLGLQVKDGQILIGFETPGSETRYPVFVIDKNNKPVITYLATDNRLTIIDGNKSGLTIPIDTLNRNNTEVMNDKMILFTSRLADKPVVTYTQEQAANANFVILKNIKGSDNNSIYLGQEYEAEVVGINHTWPGFNSMEIPKDGMILASQGIKADWIKTHLTTGDKISFSFNLKDKAGRNLEIKEAVTAWLPLVKNGRALTKEDMLEICINDWNLGTATINATDKARTAIGFTRDNKVVALAIDGSGSGNKNHGIDLPGIAARLQELGVVDAVSLDGGGSTQMNTRLFGENEVKVINQPSDGRERLVSNTILFASNAPKTNQLKELRINSDITIFRNTSYAFQVRGQDTNDNPLTVNTAAINWSLKPAQEIGGSNNSTIDKNGLFTAGLLPEKLLVTASLDSVEGQAEITVVDKVGQLICTEGGIIGGQINTPRQLHVNAFTTDGKPIIISNEEIEWSVTPASLANIDQNGIFTPLNQGAGIVKVRVGEQELLLDFVAGQESQMIESYELLDAPYYIDGYIGGSYEISKEQAKEGSYSLKVNYDYANWNQAYNGTINIKFKESVNNYAYTSHIRPKKMGMWVYGDGKAPWLRAVIKDGQQNAYTLNLASRIDWIGWKYVSTDIPADITMPIALDYFYMVETDKSKNRTGTVYFDDVRFILY